MSTIDLIAFAPGDPGVGLPNQQWTISDVGPLDLYEDQRATVREAFTVAFQTIADGQVKVRFSDEIAED